MLARLVCDLLGPWRVAALGSDGYVVEESVFEADDADQSRAMAHFVERMESQGFGMATVLPAAACQCGCGSKRPTLWLTRTH